MSEWEHIAGTPGAVTVDGKTYVIQPPTTGDMLREAIQMKQLARATLTPRDPLKYLAESGGFLPPAALAAAAQEAIRVATAPPQEPPTQLVQEMYGMVEGVRWRLWYHVNRSGGSLTEEAIKKLVTEFNCGCICTAIDDAIRLPEVETGKKPEPPTGTGG